MKMKYTFSLAACTTLFSCEEQVNHVPQEQCNELVQENSSLKLELAKLKSDNAALMNDNATLANNNAALVSNNSNLTYELSSMQQYQTSQTSTKTSPSKSSSNALFTGSVMETTIDGDFEGWEGETIFKMMNGTIWQQASYSYTYTYKFMPRVIIYKNSGQYYMKVEDMSDAIAVRQLK